MMREIRIHGYGGQGAVTLAHLLAQSALNNGRQGQALPSFGVERRGAPVKAGVRVSDETINIYSQSVEPDTLVLMDKKLVEAALAEGAKADSVILVNAAEPPDVPGHEVWYLDAAAIANDAGLFSAEGPFINIPMLGAAAKVVGVPVEVMEETLRERWSGKIADRNAKAVRAAYDAVTKAG